MQTLYYRYPDGSVEYAEVGDAAAFTPSPGAVEITQAEYEQRLAEIEAERQAQQEAQLAAELQALANALAELTATGLSETTARLMLGIAPDLELPPPSGSQNGGQNGGLL